MRRVVSSESPAARWAALPAKGTAVQRRPPSLRREKGKHLYESARDRDQPTSKQHAYSPKGSQFNLGIPGCAHCTLTAVHDSDSDAGWPVANSGYPRLILVSEDASRVRRRALLYKAWTLP
jgi:hypothetical protein